MTMVLSGDGTISGLSAGGLPDASVTNDDLSLSANASSVMTALNASGSAPIYACRAWVNFIGTGTVTIRGSGNVSSVTDNGQGDYTINFTTSMPDVNYATQINAWYGSDSLTSLVAACGLKRGQAPTTTTVRVQIANAVWNNAAPTDVDGNYVSIFR